MGKNPAFQFYTGDWLKDPQLQQVSFTTKGIWIDMLASMWESPFKGELSGEKSGLQRLLGATEKEFDEFFRENNILNFAYVTECNGIVTIRNRRMYREEIERQKTRKRVDKHRKESLKKEDEKNETEIIEDVKQDCNGNITPPSSSSSSITNNNTNENCPHNEIIKLYSEILPEFSTVSKINGKYNWKGQRQKNLNARWKEAKERQNLDYWERFFNFIRESKFLMGKIIQPGKTPFKGSLGWVVIETNFTNIIERYYHRD